MTQSLEARPLLLHPLLFLLFSQILKETIEKRRGGGQNVFSSFVLSLSLSVLALINDIALGSQLQQLKQGHHALNIHIKYKPKYIKLQLLMSLITSTIFFIFS